MAAKVIPSATRVVVLREAPEEKREGIIIPESARKKSMIGRVIAIGSAVTGYQAGDQVLLSVYGGLEAQLPNGENVVLFQENEILGKFIP